MLGNTEVTHRFLTMRVGTSNPSVVQGSTALKSFPKEWCTLLRTTALLSQTPWATGHLNITDKGKITKTFLASEYHMKNHTIKKLNIITILKKKVHSLPILIFPRVNSLIKCMTFKKEITWEQNDFLHVKI